MKRGFLQASASGAKSQKPISKKKEDGQSSIAKSEDQKSPDAIKPKDLDNPQAFKFTYSKSTGWTLKILHHTFIHAVVPDPSSSAASDGTTDVLFYGFDDQKRVPKYLSSIRKPPTQVYTIRHGTDEKMGLGMFATCDIQAGDLILNERPFLLVPKYLESHLITGQRTVFSPLKMVANRQGFESIFCPFFERVSKEKQDEFWKLQNSYPEEEVGPYLGIMRTNNFEHTFEDPATGCESYYGLYKSTSRINHSCAGLNAQHRPFDVKSFSMEVRALRDIKAGDEIFVSYCSDKPRTIAERREHLGNYGFQCTCASCTNPLSDHLLPKILTSHENLQQSYQSWLKDLTLPDDHIIKPSLLWVSLIEQQGLLASMIYYAHLDIIVQSYVALGDVENSVKYGVKTARYLIAMTGMEHVLAERSNPNYYLRDKNFGIRRGKGNVFCKP